MTEREPWGFRLRTRDHCDRNTSCSLFRDSPELERPQETSLQGRDDRWGRLNLDAVKRETPVLDLVENDA